MTVSNRTVGSVAQYKCYLGHNMYGQATRVCHADGQWFPAAPLCKGEYFKDKHECGLLSSSIVVDCGKLEHPRNGIVTLKKTVYNSVAIYKCEGGYKLVGPSKRICLASGQWDGKAPICKGVS